MEPDVVEIAPPPPSFASGSRSRKPRKAVAHEVIDVEQYESRNGGGGGVDNNNDNFFDKKKKGKAVQDGSFYHHDPFSHLDNGMNPMEIDDDDYAMFQAVLNSQDFPTDVEVSMSTTQPWGFPNSSSKGTTKSSRTSSTKVNWNPPSLETLSLPRYSYSGSAFPQNNQAYYSPEMADQTNYSPAMAAFLQNNQSPAMAAFPQNNQTNYSPAMAAFSQNNQTNYSPAMAAFFQNNQTNYSPAMAAFSQNNETNYSPAMAAFSQMNQTNYSPAMASATTVLPQTPNIVMMPAPPSRPLRFDGSASASRPIPAVVIPSGQANFLRDFKRFDTVEDFSDHHYVSKGKASKQHSKPWVKKVQADWKILENDLPETIFVRACESRMDLLRAVIIGAEGTPYHDGLFFFDIQFPDNYPSSPPKVHYHSGGLRINPNLYNCGKVCLSLLGTWSGSTREKWLPKESTMLQLLVSIQALILNQKPYFNEPGYERSMGSQSGEAHSKSYSENVFVLSLKTMVYSMRKPPKHFEEFVRCHYFVRALDIAKACKAYKDGAPVASIVKGGVQDIEESSQSGSTKFRTDVGAFMKTVVDEFVKLGVKELEEKPKPPPVVDANAQSNKANRKRGRSSR